MFNMDLEKAVQFTSVTQSCVTLCDAINYSTPGLPVHHQLPESTQTHVHWVGDAIQPSHPVVHFFHPQTFTASGSFQMSQLFASGGQSIGVSASSPLNEHPELISFRMDCLDILAVQGTLKSLLQHHSSKASIVQRLAFFQRRQWHPTPVLLPGKSHGQQSLVVCCLWGRTESDKTEAT